MNIREEIWDSFIEQIEGDERVPDLLVKEIDELGLENLDEGSWKEIMESVVNDAID
jgi:hypothetical protein